MEQERILNLEEVDVIPDDAYIMLDRPTTETLKMNWGTLKSKFYSSLRNCHNGELVKIDDNRFNVYTNGYLDFSRKARLEDGYKIYLNIKIDSSYNRNTFQPIANPTINVDGTGYKPIFNGVWYDNFPYIPEGTIKAFDKATFSPEPSLLRYVEHNDSWLYYKLINPSGTLKTTFKSSAQLHGSFVLQGATINASSGTVYPILSKIFGTQVPDLGDVVLANYGVIGNDTTTIGIINEGQSETPTITQSETDTTKGSFNFPTADNVVENGIFYEGEMDNAIYSDFQNIYSQKNVFNRKFSLNFFNNYNNINQTLGRRLGVLYHFNL